MATTKRRAEGRGPGKGLDGGPMEESWRQDVPPGLEHGLPNYWFPIALSSEVLADKPFPVTALCEELVVWRDGSGAPHVFLDFCPHRAVKLSMGNVLGDHLQCAYHGLEFDGSGSCTYIPWEGDDPAKCGVVRAKTYPASEVGGFIWSYIGDVEIFPPSAIEDAVPLELLHEDLACYVQRQDLWEINWLLAWDGSFDPQHNPFLHADGVTIKRFGGRQGGTFRMGTRALTNGVKIQRLGADNRVERDLDGGWMLPGINTLVALYPEGGPVVQRSWRFPQDGEHTHVMCSWGRVARTPAERQSWEQLFYTRTLPDAEKINAQDRAMLMTQKGLAHARSNEQLLNCDVSIVQIRRLLRDEFLAQQEGRRRESSPWGPLYNEPWLGHVTV
jgi:phenylpropionate dioxygenase-like ring-hydroxylating dioxygenase large terminal subunit